MMLFESVGFTAIGDSFCLFVGKQWEAGGEQDVEGVGKTFVSLTVTACADMRSIVRTNTNIVEYFVTEFFKGLFAPEVNI